MKQILRLYGLGLFTATIIIGIYYFYFEDHKTEVIHIEMTEDEMITHLESAGYSIYESEPKSIDQSDDQNTIPEQESTDNLKDTEHFTLIIEPGMIASTIGADLLQANIILSEMEFIDYLVENHYEKSIQVGQYELTSDMTIPDIIEIITN